MRDPKEIDNKSKHEDCDPARGIPLRHLPAWLEEFAHNLVDEEVSVTRGASASSRHAVSSRALKKLVTEKHSSLTHSIRGLLPWYIKVVASLTSPQPFAATLIVLQDLSTSIVSLHTMEGLCRTTNLCKAGLIAGALRIACNGLCTADRCHTAEDNPGCLLGLSEGPDCLRHYNPCPTLFRSILAIWPGTGERISPTAYLQRLVVQNCGSKWHALHSRVWFMRCCSHGLHFAENAPGPWSQFPCTDVWQNEEDDCPVSSVGPHLPDDVLRNNSD